MATSGVMSYEEEDELVTDLIESGGKHDWTGMIVWGEPWDLKNWEVTEAFLKRWAWLFAGCGDVIRATNSWRLGRGERPLSLEQGAYTFEGLDD